MSLTEQGNNTQSRGIAFEAAAVTHQAREILIRLKNFQQLIHNILGVGGEGLYHGIALDEIIAAAEKVLPPTVERVQNKFNFPRKEKSSEVIISTDNDTTSKADEINTITDTVENS